MKHQAIWHRQAVRSRRPVVRRVTAGGIVAAAALAVPALATGPATASHAPGGARGAATAAVSGTLRAWGLGGNGQLGNGTTQTSTVPIKVKLPAGTKVTSVRAGCFHSLALTSTGQALAWGFNAVGQLGNGSTTDSDTPVPVSVAAGITVAGIAAGDLHSLALTSTGQVWAWGFGLQGELGNGATNSSDTPVMVTLPPGTTVRNLSAGCEHSLAVTSTGQVLAWGFNADGELGNGTTGGSDVPVPASLPQGTVATAVSAGCNHSVALTSDGRVLAWGRNDNGQLGNASTTSSDVPVQVNLPAGVTAVATGVGPEASVSFAIVQKTAS